MDDIEPGIVAALDDAEDSDTEDVDEVFVRPQLPKNPSQVYCVPIPVERIGQLRRVAERDGLQPTALIRKWVIARLDSEEA
jgi:hypothetical protein